MKEIKLIKASEHIIGALRVDAGLFKKIEKLAAENDVSNQEIVRAILIYCIDDIKFV